MSEIRGSNIEPWFPKTVGLSLVYFAAKVSMIRSIFWASPGSRNLDRKYLWNNSISEIVPSIHLNAWSNSNVEKSILCTNEINTFEQKSSLTVLQQSTWNLLFTKVIAYLSFIKSLCRMQKFGDVFWRSLKNLRFYEVFYAMGGFNVEFLDCHFEFFVGMGFFIFCSNREVSLDSESMEELLFFWNLLNYFLRKDFWCNQWRLSLFVFDAVKLSVRKNVTIWMTSHQLP